ncbi:polyprenyl synthetase family protein [Nonlabens ponticola]|uniref:Polyprenyl synthetase family protein n=1 Tax=Nonlabens ponticola TaxID=2496866 RepID=A0A3S9MUT2_9FLAO|nr:polyprenyl synthetase family protein [Nonlabens ponticola]AZQ42939.1 polyprenyl synthetase family protein [Nonlabens ponticola]
MTSIHDYREVFLAYLKKSITQTKPVGLYDPVHYILDLGGKRLRPVMTLLAADVYGEDYTKALDAAVAVEVFHNFTLLHDDIMDAAPLRRGMPTVHKKWDENTGILSGDAMMILAYQSFNAYQDATYKSLMTLFSKTALEVCEGQQYDVDFETRDDVTVDEYLLMIKLKTSVLVACALQMGAIIAGKDRNEQQRVYQYGIELGLAFQLMDDYLDAYGDPETFGKEVGGDIRENKKTYLYLMSEANATYTNELRALFSVDHATQTDEQIDAKKEKAKQLFDASGGKQATLDAIKKHTAHALEIIETLDISQDHKKMLAAFSKDLMSRIS